MASSGPRADLQVLESIQRRVLWLAALTGRYIGDHWGPRPPGRFIAMVGDAELDEGNVWESLLEEHVAGLGNLLWIVDINRQSLDRVTPDGRRRQMADWFGAAGWRVI